MLIREDAPAQHSATEMPSATTESNHQSEALWLYMSVETTMAADSTATAPDVIASFLRLSDRNFLCIEQRRLSKHLPHRCKRGAILRASGIDSTEAARKLIGVAREASGLITKHKESPSHAYRYPKLLIFWLALKANCT